MSEIATNPPQGDVMGTDESYRTGKSYQLVRAATADDAGAVEWGRLIWIADRAKSGVESTLGYVEILPGKANPLHRHKTCSETMLLLEGSLRHVVGEESVDLDPGDALIVPPGMRHGAINTGSSPARMVVVYDTGQRDFEVVE